jgi:hypothetical protein
MPGKTIKGEDITIPIPAAKVEGVTATSKMPELKGASAQTSLSPGPASSNRPRGDARNAATSCFATRTASGANGKRQT